MNHYSPSPASTSPTIVLTNIGALSTSTNPSWLTSASTQFFGNLSRTSLVTYQSVTPSRFCFMAALETISIPCLSMKQWPFGAFVFWSLPSIEYSSISEFISISDLLLPASKLLGTFRLQQMLPCECFQYPPVMAVTLGLSASLNAHGERYGSGRKFTSSEVCNQSLLFISFSPTSIFKKTGTFSTTRYP